MIEACILAAIKHDTAHGVDDGTAVDSNESSLAVNGKKIKIAYVPYWLSLAVVK